MISMNVNPDQRIAVVSYPASFRLPKKEVKVTSVIDVKQKYEVEVREFIFNTLRKWVLSRNNAYKANKQLTPQRSNSVDKVLLMLMNHKTSRLHILCKRIVQDGDHFVNLFPNKHSRCFMYFKEIISQILIWCEWYSENHEQFNKNLIRKVN